MNPKFDVDLKFGQEGEEWLKLLLVDNARVEVKRERDQWASTGNIVFEVECRGKPSGLEATDAEYWVHVLDLGGVPQSMFLWRTDVLRERLYALWSLGSDGPVKEQFGGDDNASRLLVVPLASTHLLLPNAL